MNFLKIKYVDPQYNEFYEHVRYKNFNIIPCRYIPHICAYLCFKQRSNSIVFLHFISTAYLMYLQLTILVVLYYMPILSLPKDTIVSGGIDCIVLELLRK